MPAAPMKRKLGELQGRRVSDVRRALDFGDAPKRLKLTILADVQIQ